jgi:hypothetical protein
MFLDFKKYVENFCFYHLGFNVQYDKIISYLKVKWCVNKTQTFIGINTLLSLAIIMLFWVHDFMFIQLHMQMTSPTKRIQIGNNKNDKEHGQTHFWCQNNAFSHVIWVCVDSSKLSKGRN